MFEYTQQELDEAPAWLRYLMLKGQAARARKHNPTPMIIGTGEPQKEMSLENGLVYLVGAAAIIVAFAVLVHYGYVVFV